MNPSVAKGILALDNIEIIPERGSNTEAVVICDGVFNRKKLRAMICLMDENEAYVRRAKIKKEKKRDTWLD